MSKSTLDILTVYNWPGNVRELQNLVERLSTVVPEPVIRCKHLGEYNQDKNFDNMTLKEAVSAFEKQYIYEVLESVDGSRTRAAKILDIHRNTLLTKTTEFGIKI
jgi:transcriptional regulator with PAS, ATPase and Fis domain